MAIETATGVSELELTDEAADILREIRGFLTAMRGDTSETLTDFDSAVAYLHGETAMQVHDDDGAAESQLQEMLGGTKGMEETHADFAALSLEKNRRLALYVSNREEAESEFIVDEIFGT